jgi:hypothetical protein
MIICVIKSMCEVIVLTVLHPKHTENGKAWGSHGGGMYEDGFLGCIAV